MAFVGRATHRYCETFLGESARLCQTAMESCDSMDRRLPEREGRKRFLLSVAGQKWLFYNVEECRRGAISLFEVFKHPQRFIKLSTLNNRESVRSVREEPRSVLIIWETESPNLRPLLEAVASANPGHKIFLIDRKSKLDAVKIAKALGIPTDLAVKCVTGTSDDCCGFQFRSNGTQDANYVGPVSLSQFLRPPEKPSQQPSQVAPAPQRPQAGPATDDLDRLLEGAIGPASRRARTSAPAAQPKSSQNPPRSGDGGVDSSH